jgi:hypothetical protein
MGRKRKITAIPTFFSLPDSKRMSFKVANKSNNAKTSNDGVTINDGDIQPRLNFIDEFEISLNSTLGRPRIFTPEQQYNYKSAWKRYEKGMKLVEEDKVLKDPHDENKYKVPSSKSPKGYWEIQKFSVDNPDDPENNMPVTINPISMTLNQINEEENFDGQSNINNDSQDAAYQWNLAINNNEIISNQSINVSRKIQTVSTGSLSVQLNFQGLSDKPITRFVAITKFELSFSTSGEIMDDSPIDALQVEHNGDCLGGSFELRAEDNDLYSNQIINGEDSFLFMPFSIGYSHSFYIPLSLLVIQGYSIALRQTTVITDIEFDDGSIWQDNGDGDGDGDGDENDWKCNCPDSSKKKSANPNDTSGNESPEEDFTDSDAGAQNGECKHIWAVRILRHEVAPEDIPTDMPIESDPETPFPGNVTPKIISNSNSGFGNWQPGKRRRGGDKF